MRRILTNLLLVVVSLGIFVIAIELALRIFPELLMPKGAYGISDFDRDTGLKVHDGLLIYNKVRYVERKPNDEGFMDVNHDIEKKSVTYRVGFFGDSYVESIQVPLEETFFRLVPAQIANRDIETFGIGISGFGTLHSLMNYKKFGKKYDLDLVIYLFVKNDPGDNLGYFRKGSGIPFAITAANQKGYEVINEKGGWLDQQIAPSIINRTSTFLTRHSFFARMLRTQIWAAMITLQQNQKNSKASKKGVPIYSTNQNDLPTQWPPIVLADAKSVTAALLKEFSDEVARDGRDFAVMFVPRLHEELEGRLVENDSWLPWLAQTCDELEIQLLNPLPLLSELRSQGETIYDDHWSPSGHRAIANFLTAFIANRFR